MGGLQQNFVRFDKATRQIICQGDWSLANLGCIRKQFENISLLTESSVIFDGGAITRMDSAGAWQLNQYLSRALKQSLKIHLQHFSEASQALLSLVEKQQVDQVAYHQPRSMNWVAKIGRYVVQQVKEFQDYLHFIGQLTMEAVRVMIHPSHLRWRETISIIDKAGFQALPIVALLSCMIGVVLAYQMGLQLRQYGANIYIVDLVGLSILREFGPLITAIMIAGRTGSAFTAQLGIMKINQEIDALNTMGVTPAELLLLPRLAGLFIALPLLTMWSDIFGVIGGMIMAHSMLDINWYDFVLRFQHVIPLRALIIGIGKAPVFALIIGSIGCFEGTQVKGSADSVGTQTTRSVVLAIFFIVVADATLSVIFSKFNL